jgi:hypothetical protein
MLQSRQPTQYMSAGCEYRGNIAYCDVTIEDYNKSQPFKQKIFFFILLTVVRYYYYYSYEDIKVRVLGDLLCKKFRILFSVINNKDLIFISNLRITRVSIGI